MTTITVVLLSFCGGLLGKKLLDQKAAERKAEREKLQKIRQDEDDATRYFLIRWAFGSSALKNAPSITLPMNRGEVVGTLRNRDAAIKLLEAIPVSRHVAEQEYVRFINWFNLTDGESELHDALPMYLLALWADFDHPYHSTDEIKLLMEKFALTERQARSVTDKYLDMLP